MFCKLSFLLLFASTTPSVQLGVHRVVFDRDHLLRMFNSTEQRWRKARDDMHTEIGCGIGDTDSRVLLSAATLANVDVMLESGTAYGHSAAMMGRFFEGTPVQIFTVDLNQTNKKEKGYSRCAAGMSSAPIFLSKFPNVKSLVGDGIKLIPELIYQHRGKRIGLFIDGPKDEEAIQLCWDSLQQSKDVKFCAMHDMTLQFGNTKPAKLRAVNKLKRWSRTVFLGYNYTMPQPMSLAILAGLETIPHRVKGDSL